jgi:hypothetical protein
MNPEEQVVEKVFTPEDGKLYQLKEVYVTNLDSKVFDIFDSEVVIESPTPVYAVGDDSKKIGFANLYMKDGPCGSRYLVAEINIEYSSEERLLIETGAVRLYARVFGRMHCERVHFFDFNERIRVDKLKIDGIQLSSLPAFGYADNCLKPAVGQP